MRNPIIEKFIVHLAVNDANIEFTHEWIYAMKKRKFVKSFPGIPVFEKREELYDLVIEGNLKTEQVNYLEFGVYQGESLKYWVSKHSNKDSRFYGFDSFQGLPDAWTKDRPAGSYSTKGQIPDIKDERVKFLVGLFSQTLPGFMSDGGTIGNGKRNVVHLDADLYSSTAYVLTLLMSKFKKNDIIIFDEFGFHLLHEFKAFLDFIEMSGIKYTCLGATKGFNQAAFLLL